MGESLQMAFRSNGQVCARKKVQEAPHLTQLAFPIRLLCISWATSLRCLYSSLDMPCGRTRLSSDSCRRTPSLNTRA